MDLNLTVASCPGDRCREKKTSAESFLKASKKPPVAQGVCGAPPDLRFPSDAAAGSLVVIARRRFSVATTRLIFKKLWSTSVSRESAAATGCLRKRMGESRSNGAEARLAATENAIEVRSSIQ